MVGATLSKWDESKRAYANRTVLAPPGFPPMVDHLLLPSEDCLLKTRHTRLQGMQSGKKPSLSYKLAIITDFSDFPLF